MTLVEIAPEGDARVRHIDLSPRRDLRIIEGSLEVLLHNGKTDVRADDFILARVSNTESILDVMGKLRDVYPNVLQMQYTGVREAGPLPGAGREMLKKTHMALFEDFFNDVHVEPLSEAQRTYMVNLLEHLAQEETA